MSGDLYVSMVRSFGRGTYLSSLRLCWKGKAMLGSWDILRLVPGVLRAKERGVMRIFGFSNTPPFWIGFWNWIFSGRCNVNCDDKRMCGDGI